MRTNLANSRLCEALYIGVLSVFIGLLVYPVVVVISCEPMSAVGRNADMALAGRSVQPRIEHLPYEPTEESEKSFVVNLFRYVWVVGLMLIVGPVTWRGFAWLRKRWRYRAPTRCKSCGYDLSRCAEPGCPECGVGRDGGHGVSVRESDAVGSR